MRQGVQAGPAWRHERRAFLAIAGLLGGIAWSLTAAEARSADGTILSEAQVFAAVARRVDTLLPDLGPDALAAVREQAKRTQAKLGRIEARQAELLRRFDGPPTAPASTPHVPERPAPVAEEASSPSPSPPARAILPPPTPASSPTPVPAPSKAPTPRPSPLTADERSTLVSDAVRTFGATLDEAGRKHGLEARFLLCVMNIESAFRPDAESRAGAVGLLQLMPSTAAELGANPWDIRQNILAGARLIDGNLRRYGEDVSLAMAAYNAGPGAVERYKGVPPFPETRAYVSRITRECGAPRPAAASRADASKSEGKESR